MAEDELDDQTEYDKVTQASLNGLYVKAQELDRGHNTSDAPAARPPGSNDSSADASTHASDAQSHASDAETHASDAETHASTHASENADAESHASEW